MQSTNAINELRRAICIAQWPTEVNSYCAMGLVLFDFRVVVSNCTSLRIAYFCANSPPYQIEEHPISHLYNPDTANSIAIDMSVIRLHHRPTSRPCMRDTPWRTSEPE